MFVTVVAGEMLIHNI